MNAMLSVYSEAFQQKEREGSKPKLTVCRVLRRCSDFDENLTRTRLRHVYEAKRDPAFGYKGSPLLDGSHFDEQQGLCDQKLYSPKT